MAGIEEAIRIAVEAHAGQTDKNGEPYILHVLRVMHAATGPDAKIAAVLHDVIEDTEWTAERLLAAGFEPKIVDAVLSVTKRDGESYQDFVLRAKTNPIGRIVKMADLADNADPARLSLLPAEKRERLERKYAGALEQLAG